jgi:DNA ligase (NAD+)
MNNTVKKYMQINDLEYLMLIKDRCDDLYYNTGMESELTDSEYDTLKSYLENKGVVIPTGAVLRDGQKHVKLPIQMKSMDKVTSDKKLHLWLKKNSDMRQWITESKLDGVSCMAIYDIDGNIRLYTRGDGSTGTDISHLSSLVHGIPSSGIVNINVRGELIIPKDKFSCNWASMFANARNMVSGCVNAKTIRPGVSDIHFVAYELIDVTNGCISPSEQLRFLTSKGFECVSFNIHDTVCDFSLLHDIYNSSHHGVNTSYETDGMIVQPNNPYVHDQTRNPIRAVAYKEEGESKTVNVIRVLWEETKWGKLKPRAEISPVNIGGVTIKYVTLYNASYVVNHGIVEGTIVRITRSGDVIPKIIEVVDKSGICVMPDMKWKWDDNKVDIISSETDSDTRAIKRLVSFFENVNCKHVGEKIIGKLYTHGFNTIKKLLDATPGDFIQVDGFKQTLADNTSMRIRESVRKARDYEILSGSGVLGDGFGETKCKLLFETIPDLLTVDINEENVACIPGFSLATAKHICSFLGDIKDLFIMLSEYREHQLSRPVKPLRAAFNDVRPEEIVFSGFRDDELQSNLEMTGYVISKSVTKNTKFLLVKSLDANDTTKTKKAREYGVEIVTRSKFC